MKNVHQHLIFCYTETLPIKFHFLSILIEYDSGDSFPFDFETKIIPLGSKSKVKLSPRSYSIQFERKWKSIFLSEYINSNY